MSSGISTDDTTMLAVAFLITLATASSTCVPKGRRGQQVHPSTLLRWITRGARSRSGRRVRLAGTRLGTTWYTSAAAVQKFMSELSELSGGESDEAASPRTPNQRRRASELAERELAEAGI